MYSHVHHAAKNIRFTWLFRTVCLPCHSDILHSHTPSLYIFQQRCLWKMQREDQKANHPLLPGVWKQSSVFALKIRLCTLNWESLHSLLAWLHEGQREQQLADRLLLGDSKTRHFSSASPRNSGIYYYSVSNHHWSGQATCGCIDMFTQLVWSIGTLAAKQACWISNSVVSDVTADVS